MKNNGVRYTFLVLTTMLYLTPFVLFSQNTFNKTFGFQGHREEFSSLLQVEDTYFFAGGSKEENSSNNVVKLIILNTDLNGLFLDSLNHQFGNNSFGLADNANSLLYKDSNLLIASVLKNIDSTNIQDGMLVRFKDFDLTPQHQHYEFDSAEVFMSLKELNNQLLVFGQTNSFGNGRADYYLLKTDTFGNIITDTTYGGSDFEQIGNGFKVNENLFVFCGLTYSETNPRPYYLNPAANAQFIAVDSNFNEVWNTVLYSIGIDRVPMIKEYGFFHYFVEYPILPPPIYLDDFVPLVGKMDLLTGSLTWLDTIKIEEEIIAPKYMETVDSSSFIVFCEVESSGIPYSYAKIIMFNSFGDIIWQRSYYEGNHNGCKINCMIVDDDGYLVFGGTIANLETQSQDAWLLKLRPDGCLDDTDCGITTGLIDLTPSMNQFNIQVYPNPVKDNAHIVVENTTAHYNKNLTLQLIDLSGKTVHQESIQLKGQLPQFTIDVSDYETGVYIINTIIDGVVKGSGKLVVE